MINEHQEKQLIFNTERLTMVSVDLNLFHIDAVLTIRPRMPNFFISCIPYLPD